MSEACPSGSPSSAPLVATLNGLADQAHFAVLNPNVEVHVSPALGLHLTMALGLDLRGERFVGRFGFRPAL